jgi:hypothetical protein
MRIIIAGSRTFNDYNTLKNKIVEILKQLQSEGYTIDKKTIEIISGTANGADKLGEKFAIKFDFNLTRFPADWNRFGNSAGYKRNEKMAIYASEDDTLGVLLAFWDGKSSGTQHMINLANKYKLRVFIINFQENKVHIEKEIIITQEDKIDRNIGTYNKSSNTFTSIRHYSRHFMRKYEGWGLDKETIEILAKNNSTIIIIDVENHIKYIVNANIFLQKGIEANFKSHKKQLFLNKNQFINEATNC